MFQVKGLYGQIQRNNMKAGALFAAFMVLFLGIHSAVGFMLPYLQARFMQEGVEGGFRSVFEENANIRHRLEEARARTQSGDTDHAQNEAVARDGGSAAAGPHGIESVFGGDAGLILVGNLLRSTPLVLLSGALSLLIAAWWNGLYIRYAMRARPVSRSEQPELYTLVENLTMLVGMPCPAIEIINSPKLNAYASGLTLKSARIGLTTGLLRTLDRDELEAVIAHELTHIRQGDPRLMALTKACVDLLTAPMRRQWTGLKKTPWVLYIFPFMFLVIIAGRNGFVSFLPIFIMLGFSLLIVALTYLIKALILHSREFVADAGAIELTKNPAALIAALRKMDGADDLDVKGMGAQALLFSSSVSGLMSTHPSIDSRIDAIRALGGVSRADDMAHRARPVRAVVMQSVAAGVASNAGVTGAAGAAGIASKAGARAAFGRRGMAGSYAAMPMARGGAPKFAAQASATAVWRDDGVFSTRDASEEDYADGNLFQKWVLSGRLNRVAEGAGRARNRLARWYGYALLALFGFTIVLPALMRSLF